MNDNLDFIPRPDSWSYEPDLSHEIFHELELSESHLDSLGALNASLKRARFDRAHLRFASFHSADLTEASFARASLHRPTFHFAEAPESSFHRAIIDAGSMPAANFRGADFSDAVFVDCNMEDCDFTGADLSGARFARCDFGQSVFTDTSFDEATFESCDFSRSELDAGAFENAQNYFTHFPLNYQPGEQVLSGERRQAFNLLMAARTERDRDPARSFDGFQEAIAALDSAGMNSHALEARYDLAHLLMRTSALDRALEMIESIEDQLENSELHSYTYLGAWTVNLKLRLIHDDIEARKVLLKKLWRDYRDEPLALEAAVDAIFTLGFHHDPEEAIEFFSEASAYEEARDPSVRRLAFRATSSMGLRLSQLGRFDRAEEILGSVEARTRLDAFCYEQWMAARHNIANIYKDRGQLEKALDLYREVADSRNRRFYDGEEMIHVLATHQVAEVYKQLGRDVEAQPYWLEAARFAGRPLYTASSFAIRALNERARYERYALGHVHQAYARYGMAARRAESFDVDDPDIRFQALHARVQRARMRLEQGLPRQARRQIDLLIEHYGDHPSTDGRALRLVAHVDRGMCCRELGDIDEAVADYRRAFQIANAHPQIPVEERAKGGWAMVDAGHVLAGSGRHEEALETLDLLVGEWADVEESKLRSEVGWALMLAVESHEKLGDFEAAIESCRRVRELLEADEPYGNARAAYASSLRREAELNPDSAGSLIAEFERRYREDADPNVKFEVDCYDESH